MTVLPDVLAPDLDIVFCGTAVSAASARKEAYYAGPGNAFWPTLHKVGLTPREVRPEEYIQLTRWKMGFTDLAKNTSGNDRGLSKAHFDVARLGSLIMEYRPRIVAFTSKRAAQEFVGHSVDYGLLPDAVGQTILFVLPSPSGAARRYWSERHWQELCRLRGSAK
jgi:TDG/mug DNA glycosylase family protein